MGARLVIVAQRSTFVHLWCQPAWLYVGIDEARLSDELHKPLVRARKRGLTMDQVYDGLENQGVFCLLSGTPHEVEDILPEYYVR